MRSHIFAYIAVMAIVTFLVRALPLTLIRTEIKSRWIHSFLYYLPFATLAAMTVPAIFTATSNAYSAAAGFLVALALSFFRRSLLTVAAGACIAVYIAELF